MPGAHNFGLWTAQQLFAPLQPPTYVLDGLLRAGSVTTIVGGAGSKKSWLALSLALCSAWGKPWLGQYATRGGNAVVLDYEMGGYELSRRLQMLNRGLGLSYGPQTLQARSFPEIYLNSDAFAEAMLQLAQTTALVVIDSLAAALPGADENAAVVRYHLDSLHRIGDTTGCSFLVVHHTNKTGTIRGSSAIEQACDEVLIVRPGDDDSCTMAPTKGRHGQRVQEIAVGCEEVSPGAMVLTRRRSVPTTARRGDDEVILEYIGQHPGCGKRDVRSGVSLRNDAVDGGLQRLLSTGKIVNQGSGQRHSYHCVDTGSETGGAPAAPGSSSPGPGVPTVPRPPLGGRHGHATGDDRAGTVPARSGPGGELGVAAGPWRIS